MKFKYVYSKMMQSALLCRYCGAKGNAVADELEVAVKMLKWAARQKKWREPVNVAQQRKAKILRVCSTCGNLKCLNNQGTLCHGAGYDQWQPRKTSAVA